MRPSPSHTTSQSRTIYGCSAGTGYATLRTNKGYGNIGTYLDQVRITITNPPTPTPEPVTPPSNLRYSAGTTWVNAVWDSTSGLTYRARISGGNWRSTTGSSMFFSGLQMGTPYTVYVYAQNSSGDKSDTVSINVETGCSFPGGHCIVLQSEEETRSNSDSHGNDLPLQPYNTQWKPIAWMRTYLTQKSKLGILHRFEGGSSRYEQL